MIRGVTQHRQSLNMNKNPEQSARDNIDAILERSGWVIVDKTAINLSLGLGLAVRGYQTDYYFEWLHIDLNILDGKSCL